MNAKKRERGENDKNIFLSFGQQSRSRRDHPRSIFFSSPAFFIPALSIAPLFLRDHPGRSQDPLRLIGTAKKRVQKKEGGYKKR